MLPTGGGWWAGLWLGLVVGGQGWWAGLVGKVMVMVMVMVRLGGQALWERLWFGFVGKVMVRLGGYGYG